MPRADRRTPKTFMTQPSSHMSSYCQDRAALYAKWFKKEGKGAKGKKGPNAWKDMMDSMTWPQIHEVYKAVSMYSTSGLSGPDFAHLKNIMQEYAMGTPRKKRGKQSSQDRTDLAVFSAAIEEEWKRGHEESLKRLKNMKMTLKPLQMEGDTRPPPLDLPPEGRLASWQGWTDSQQAQPLPGPLSWDKYNISQQSQQQSQSQQSQESQESPTTTQESTLRLSQMYFSQDNDNDNDTAADNDDKEEE